MDEGYSKQSSQVDTLSWLQQQTGDRYRTMIFYQKFCEVMAWINLGLGIVTFLIIWRIALTSRVPGGIGAVVLGYGFLALLGGIGGFLTCKLVANFIRGFVDIAVNSHLQVYLLRERRSPAE